MFALGITAALVLMTAAYVMLRARRLQLYRDLAALQVRSLAEVPAPALSPRVDLPNFSDRLARLPDVLPATTFDALRTEILALVSAERSYLPTHKKGGTVAYETLCAKAPHVIGLYLDPGFCRLLSDLTGVDLKPTPIHDQSSCSVLFYDRPGDHIGWHYDHNFYRGSHFTVLLGVVNEGHSEDGLSAAKLMAERADGVVVVPTPVNTLVVFEGAKVRHKVTPIADGERRVMLSMTYCSDPRSTLAQGIQRRVKDIAFFGVRALWT